MLTTHSEAVCMQYGVSISCTLGSSETRLNLNAQFDTAKHFEVPEGWLKLKLKLTLLQNIGLPRD